MKQRAFFLIARDTDLHIRSLTGGALADSRQVFVNQADTALIGQTLMDAVYDITGGEGQWTILSATSQAANQNAWIEAMQNVMESDEKYANLEIVDIVYGDDEPQPSTEQPQALLQNYPDLKLICAPTTVGINVAAKVLQDQNSDVKITGAADETFEAGDMENSPYTIVEASDGGTEIILGEPFELNPDNIAEWADVF